MWRGVKSRSDDDVSTPGPPLTKQRARQLYLQAKGLCIICGKRPCYQSKVRCRPCKKRDAILRSARERMGDDWTPLYKKQRPVTKPWKPKTRNWKVRVKRVKAKLSRAKRKHVEPEEKLTLDDQERRSTELHNMAMVIRAAEIERMAKLIRAELKIAAPAQKVAIINPNQTTKSSSTIIGSTS